MLPRGTALPHQRQNTQRLGSNSTGCQVLPWTGHRLRNSAFRCLAPLPPCIPTGSRAPRCPAGPRCFPAPLTSRRGPARPLRPPRSCPDTHPDAIASSSLPDRQEKAAAVPVPERRDSEERRRRRSCPPSPCPAPGAAGIHRQPHSGHPAHHSHGTSAFPHGPDPDSPRRSFKMLPTETGEKNPL